MTVDVSVVIPFFNPGTDIDDCVTSMLAQTMASDRFEVILLDDGSTDGSAAVVDDWVARYPDRLRVLHLAASGGPAHPRNVGIGAARGRFIQFVDSDDTLAPQALEHLLAIATESDADVVVSKISAGGPRAVYHPLFRRTETRLTFADYPRLIHNGTVCKLFRREFLLDHEIRFPEGPTYIEDQNLCLRAYANATSIAVASDIVYYFHRRRRAGGKHFGDVAVVPEDYSRELHALLDVVATEVSPVSSRIVAAARYCRNEMLGRLRGATMLECDDAYRRDLTHTLREVATSRLSPEVFAALPALHRTQAALLRNDDAAGLKDLAGRIDSLRLHAISAAPRWENGRLMVDVDARLLLDDQPFRLDRADDGWALPQSFAPGVDLADRRLTATDDADLDLDLATISRIDNALWSTTDGLTPRIDDDGTACFGGTVSLDPAKVMGGRPLTAGVWDLRLRVIFAGINRSSRLRAADAAPADSVSWLTNRDGSSHSVTSYWDGRVPGLTLDVDQWALPLQGLLDESPTALVEAPRELVMPVAAVRGQVGTTVAATVILTPVDDRDLAPINCPAELVAGPTGGALRATIPALTGGDGWRVWLRIGELGTLTPRALPIELRDGPDGRLIATATP